MLAWDPAIIKVIVLNSLLFIDRLSLLLLAPAIRPIPEPLKVLIFAPVLEEVLFRAVFYRQEGHRPALFLLLSGLVFGVCHCHRPIRKLLKLKKVRLSSVI
jgi:membrane protease YdiL (CAAX protease family)